MSELTPIKTLNGHKLVDTEGREMIKDAVTIESVTQTVTSTADGGTNTLTVNLSNGTSTKFNVQNGSKGSTGATGSQGPKGDKGDTGATGPAGANGVSPSVTVSKSGKVTTITIKDATGTKTATINDGADGADGSSGSTSETATIPSYWQTYLDERVAAINTAVETAGVRKSSFLWYTDAHWVDNYGSSPAILNYLYEHTAINKTNFGGDIAQDTEGELDIMRDEWRASIRRLPNHHSVMGNHDNQVADLPIPDGETKPLPKNKYAFFLAPEETNDMVLGTDKTHGCLYYYIDNQVEKTRYLYLSTGRMWAFAAEVKFFIDALNSTPADWHVIPISHIWLTSDYSGSAPVLNTTPPNYSKVFLDIFDAYNGRSSGTVTYSDLGISEAYDFTSGVGKIEFIIGGHIHKDYDFITTGGIPVILTECDGSGERCDECVATKGTYTENCVYAIIADYDNGLLNVLNVGRGSSRVIDLATGDSSSGGEDSGDSGETEDTTWMTTSITRVLQTSDDTVAIEWADNVDGVTYVVCDNGTEVARVTNHTQTVLFGVAAGSHSYTVCPQKSDSEVGNTTEGFAITTVADVGYTNVLRIATAADGTLYNNGYGYKENTRLSDSNAPDIVEKTATGWDVTGYIPVKAGDIVRFYNMDFNDIDGTGGEWNRNFIYGFNADYSYIGCVDGELMEDDIWGIVRDTDGDMIQFKMVSSWNSVALGASVALLRIPSKNIDAFSIITVNESINL